MPWDWNLVGEIALGMTVGSLFGGAIFFFQARTFFYEAVSHPTLTRLSQAADKLTKGGGNSFIHKGIEALFGGGKA